MLKYVCNVTIYQVPFRQPPGSQHPGVQILPAKSATSRRKVAKLAVIYSHGKVSGQTKSLPSGKSLVLYGPAGTSLANAVAKYLITFPEKPIKDGDLRQIAGRDMEAARVYAANHKISEDEEIWKRAQPLPGYPTRLRTGDRYPEVVLEGLAWPRDWGQKPQHLIHVPLSSKETLLSEILNGRDFDEYHLAACSTKKNPDQEPEIILAPKLIAEAFPLAMQKHESLTTPALPTVRPWNTDEELMAYVIEQSGGSLQYLDRGTRKMVIDQLMAKERQRWPGPPGAASAPVPTSPPPVSVKTKAEGAIPAAADPPPAKSAKRETKEDTSTERKRSSGSYAVNSRTSTFSCEARDCADYKLEFPLDRNSKLVCRACGTKHLLFHYRCQTPKCQAPTKLSDNPPDHTSPCKDCGKPY